MQLQEMQRLPSQVRRHVHDVLHGVLHALEGGHDLRRPSLHAPGEEEAVGAVQVDAPPVHALDFGLDTAQLCHGADLQCHVDADEMVGAHLASKLLRSGHAVHLRVRLEELHAGLPDLGGLPLHLQELLLCAMHLDLLEFRGPQRLRHAHLGLLHVRHQRLRAPETLAIADTSVAPGRAVVQDILGLLGGLVERLGARVEGINILR
mmetsp:Transcript_80416/g.213447  ORF Transcript_80416/g.213447 Transcript_80416/m.213447 type:complete len:206 (-) Transcript_80416:227-844(-)